MGGPESSQPVLPSFVRCVHLKGRNFDGRVGGGLSRHVTNAILDVKGHQTGDVVDVNGIVCRRASNQVGLSSIDLVGSKEGFWTIYVSDRLLQ